MTSDRPALVLYDFEADPKLPGYPTYSPYVLEVHRALSLAKLSFQHERMPFQKLKSINPLGQLPVLRIGAELVSDSTRILHRIEALAPGSMTGGLDARGIAEAWLWEEFADTALYPQVLATRWADERGWAVIKPAFFGALPPLVRDLVASMIRKKTLRSLIGRDFLRGGLDSCHERLQRMLDLLEARAPEAGFWLGERACVADIGLFAHLHAMRLPTIPYRAEAIAQRTRLSRWLDRVDAATRG
ncbi:MAG: Glutathione S-transferase [Myxococcaceae bacterium]|nr:Glutathione S-transferase [Myxococcaceae bacterium]